MTIKNCSIYLGERLERNKEIKPITLPTNYKNKCLFYNFIPNGEKIIQYSLFSIIMYIYLTLLDSTGDTVIFTDFLL